MVMDALESQFLDIKQLLIAEVPRFPNMISFFGPTWPIHNVTTNNLFFPLSPSLTMSKMTYLYGVWSSFADWKTGIGGRPTDGGRQLCRQIYPQDPK